MESLYGIWAANAANNQQLRKLREVFAQSKDIYDHKSFDEFDFLSKESKERLSYKNLDAAQKILDDCVTKNIQVISAYSPLYPPLLKRTEDSPHILYALGTIPSWDEILTVGIVGTRKVTTYGLNTTRKLANDLAAHGAVIVSGLALGVDGAAAEEAFKAGSSAIAVVAGGVDMIYPPKNKNLYYEHIKSGLLLSEYAPGTKPEHFQFPQRNKIIAGLSNCIAVTEAPKKSGAIITAHYALSQNIDVYSVPGNINVPAFEGTNKLLQNGAKVLLSAKDIIDTYCPCSYEVKQNKDDNTLDLKDPIIKLLKSGTKSLDELCILSGMSMPECSSRCFMLEIEGKISKLPGNLYCLK